MALGTDPQPGSLAAEVPHLVFSVGSERYALPLSQVTSVQPEAPITRVPAATPLLRGVMNLRGALLAVVDLAAALGLSQPDRGKGHVLVVRCAELEAGLLVEQADEVVSLNANATEPRLATLPSERAEYLDGHVRLGNSLVGLLRLERVLEAVQRG